jgi:PKD repeat protein
MTARAQSETVGVVLLVGVFAVAAITIGVLVIGNVADDAESQPRVDLNVSVTPDNVTLTHGGGDTVDVADVEVVVRNDEESRYDLSGFDERRGDGDDRFDPGERFHRDHDQGAGDLRIIVVHVPSNSVLADVTRSARTPDPPDAPLTNAEPRPRIDYAPTDPTPGEPIAFDAGASSDPDGTIARYDWDWTDDGSYEASGQTATHAYDAPGNYTVRLRVVDNGSATNTTTRTVQVAVSQPPTANVTYTPDSPGSGESITFDGSASSDPDGSITGYRWDWTGDGSYEGSGETATHTYPAPGRYDVTLEVTDDDGLTDTETRTVRVNSPPTARFGRTCADNTCTFDAANSTDDGSIANYTWQFGDGATGSGETTSHTYPDHGTYDVTLTVTDTLGATDDTTRTVDSNDPPTARFGRDCSGLECAFDAGNATDDGSITAYEWAFGDGETATTADPVINHTYDGGGSYEVTLTVTDGAGEQDGRTRTVEVNEPPNASYTYSPSVSGGAMATLGGGVPVSDGAVFAVAGPVPAVDIGLLFDASASSDPDGTIVGYEWDLNGDGSFEATGETLTPTLTLPANVTLRVTDDDGATDSLTRAVSVESTPPTVLSPTLTDANGDGFVAAGDQVTVSAAATDVETGVDTVTADLGSLDAGTVTLTENVTGLYTATATVGPNATEGDQSATITATDAAGNTATETTGTLTVDTTPPTIDTFDVVDDGSVSDSFFFGEYWDEQYDITWLVTDQRLQSTTVTVVRDGTNSATYTDSSGTRTYSPGFFANLFGPEEIPYTVRVEAEDTAGNTVCREVEDPSDGTDPSDSQYSSC